MHGVETAHSCRIYGRFSSAGDDSVGLAETEEIECVDDSVVG